MHKRIAVVVPSIRPQSLTDFIEAWSLRFSLQDVELIIVRDGEVPTVQYGSTIFSVENVMGKDADLIYNFNDGVRNLGFAFIAKQLPHIETIISFDDDVRPFGDTIQDHLDVLKKKVPTSWMSTTLGGDYMRGFPYGLREESEVVLSHGVWKGTPDLDASTQLVRGVFEPEFYKGPIPKGIHYPMCIMNVAFKRKMLQFMYQAPMGPRVGLDRFADIWSGINAKNGMDSRGWAAVTGYSTVLHERASDPFKNLVKEAKGVGMNESFWRNYDKDLSNQYYELFYSCLARWQELLEKWGCPST